MKRLLAIFIVLSPVFQLHAQCSIQSGAARLAEYLPGLGDKNFALVANHSSRVGKTHLVDTLLSLGISRQQIAAIFCPEHGFRGLHAAGERVENDRDSLTGIPVYSLYGSRKQPSAEQMEGLDLVIYDLQDVGARFYTYSATLHYIMEACAAHDIPLLVLDRPNPNGDYVDGPVLDTSYRSFVGMHPIPVVHGLTMGELARMINGEGWLEGGARCRLEVIPCTGYDHSKHYSLPVKPSPNLGNDHAIRLYPSTCFFEGTVLSEGRGTPWPFEVYGHPDLPGDFSFTPVSIPGVAPAPKWEGERCRGRDLRYFRVDQGKGRLYLEILVNAFREFPDQGAFFTSYFDQLAGSDRLRQQLQSGMGAIEIRASWARELSHYLQMQQQYLLYD